MTKTTISILMAFATSCFANIAYVPNFDNVINTDTKSVEDIVTTHLGIEPVAIGITPDGRFAYVANSASNTVSVIDLSHNRLLTKISVGFQPMGIAISPDGHYAYVSNFGNHPPTLSVINTSDHLIVGTLVGSSTTGVSIAPTPVGFTGVQKINHFVVVSERYNALSWQPCTLVTGYQLYRNGVLIAALAGSAFSYEDHNQPIQEQTYSLVAFNDEGPGSPATITVGGI